MRTRRTITHTLTVLLSISLAATALMITAGAATAAPAARPAAPAPAARPPAPAPHPAGPPVPAATPCAPSAKACFSVGRRTAWLTDGAGHPTFGPVPALGGSAAFPTPTGTYRVVYKDADHVSNLFHPGQMPNAVFFTPAIAFHQGSLSKSSHGCVHLSRSASQAFFSRLRPGDQVQVVR